MKNQAIFKIYDKQVDTSFYIHWNTYTQLPISIPLDLVSFIDYLMLEGIDLKILLDYWENLQTHGSTIPNYKPRLSSKLNFYLKQVVMRTEVLEWTEDNRYLLRLFEDQMTINPCKQYLIESLRYTHEKLNIRHVYALRSLDFTYQMLERYLRGVKNNFLNFDLDEFMQSLISNVMLSKRETEFFEKLYHRYNFPLEAIPHINRLKGDFKDCDIYGLLEFQPSLDAPLELVNLESAREDKIKILNTLCFQENEVEAERLRTKIFGTRDHDFKLMSSEKIDGILKSLGIQAETYRTLKTTEGKHYLPVLFETIMDSSDELILFKRFGFSHYDLYTRSGIFLESTPETIQIYENGYYLIEHETNSTLKRYDATSKLKHVVFSNLEKQDNYALEANPKEKQLLFNNTLYFYYETETSPNCYTHIRHLGEEYVSVCQNGLWGYARSHEHMELVIDCQYAYAGPFLGDHALVYDLKPEYRERKGTWVELDASIPIRKSDKKRKINPYQFECLYPYSAAQHSLPIKLLDEVSHDIDYMEEYNFYGYSTPEIEGIGNWLLIDQNGEIVFEAQPDDFLELLENEKLKVIDFLETRIYDLKHQIPELIETKETSKELATIDPSKQLIDDLKDIDMAKLSNPKYALKLLKLNPDFYEILPYELKDNFEFALSAALSADVVSVYSNSSKRLRKDLNFVKQLLCISTHLFKNLPENIKQNNEIIDFALSRDVSVALCLEESYPNYRNLLVEAIEDDPSNFINLPDSYKVDMQFVGDLMKANAKVGAYLTSFHLDIKYLKELAEQIGPEISSYFPEKTTSEIL